MLHWIKGKLYAKNQGPDSRDEKKICLLNNFRDRQTVIVAYRGTVCNQMRSPRVLWIRERLYAKQQGPKSRDKIYT